MSHLSHFFHSLCWVFLLCSSVHAEILQILHTNDLHGHFEGLNDEEKRGGYAQLKHKINLLRQKASRQGIESLVLDAGDFAEGSMFYKAGNGLNTFKMMELMNYDAIALGNHDYLMGPKRLEEILSEVDVPLVAANVMINPLTTASKKTIQPYRLIDKGHLKIAVVGGTTNEIFYKWIFKGNLFSDPIQSINRQAKNLSGKADVVIALTHIGLEDDKKLAARSQSIDLIVGGHTHTQLDTVVKVPNKKMRNIPIVQTGAHGKFLGELIVDVTPLAKGQKHPSVKIISYKLHPIFQKDEEDSEIEVYAKKSRSDFNEVFGEKYLHEAIGQSSIPMSASGKLGQIFWTGWMTKAMQEEVQADLAVNSLEFFGIDQTPGVITREKLLSFYPRYFDVERKQGWNIYTSEMSGHWLSLIIKICRKKNKFTIFSGLKFELMPDENGELEAVNLNIDGIEIQPFKMYKIAMPEGHFRGATAILPAIERIFNKPTDTGISFVDAIAKKIQATGTIEMTDLSRDDFSMLLDESQKKNLP